jgi:L-iditol 2-dehydrogenase
VRVAMYYRNSDVRLEEIPAPQIGEGEILVRSMACGICGSDVLEWYRIRKAPLVLGHEMGGEIAEVGGGVEGFSVGDRVFVSHHVPCNTCRHCLSGHHTACETLHTTKYYPGGFAEYIRVPAINVDRGTIVLPDSMTYDEATFIEPLACVLRGQKGLAIDPGSTVLVLGSGISGALHIVLARRLGAGRIIATDVCPFRLEMAKTLGADAVLSAREDVPAKVRQLNDGFLADRVILCTGAPAAADQALRCVERGGKVLFFAVPTGDIQVPINDFWRNDVTLMTSYAGAPSDLAQATELIRAGVVPTDTMTTHRLPLAETQRGFQLVAEAGESLKVIVYPNE